MAELSKTLSAGRGTALMLNIVLGAGLLSLPGLAVETVGASALLVWGACALAAIPLLAVFYLLGRRYSDAGGLASIAQIAFGRIGYVMVTFLLLGAVIFGLPAIAITGGHYAAQTFGGSAHVYASLLLILAVLANVLSAEIAGRVNAIIASTVVLALVVIAGLGLAFMEPGAHLVPTSSEELPSLSTFGLAFMMVFFAFTGWEVSANLGGEFKRPERDFPTAIVASFVIAVVLYVTLAIVVAGAGNIENYAAPFSAIFGAHFGPLGSAAIGVLSIVMVFANLSGAVWAVSRMVYSGATQGLFPSWIGTLRNGVPYRAVLITVTVLLAVTIISGLGGVHLGNLLVAAGQNFLLIYGIAAAALVKLALGQGSRVLGVLSLALVLGLIVARGIEGIFYPLALISCAAIVTGTSKRHEETLDDELKTDWETE